MKAYFFFFRVIAGRSKAAGSAAPGGLTKVLLFPLNQVKPQNVRSYEEYAARRNEGIETAVAAKVRQTHRGSEKEEHAEVVEYG